MKKFLKFNSGRRFYRKGYHHRDKISKINANNLNYFKMKNALSYLKIFID